MSSRRWSKSAASCCHCNASAWETSASTRLLVVKSPASNLRYTLRRFMDFSTSAAQEEGLLTQQHQALLAIKGHRGEKAMTDGMLAQRLLIAPHSATELVGRLAVAGYVLVRRSERKTSANIGTHRQGRGCVDAFDCNSPDGDQGNGFTAH
ncbi:hypothetical protein QO004_005753 [Rhizobium mesoamericanum]|nr:hypothetical protein [Rhizobium mesoamericanum]